MAIGERVGEREFDVIVVGAGPAGEVLAGRVAERSEMSVAIVEGDLIGGECSHYSCMPSKALLRPPSLLNEVKRVPGVLELVGDRQVDVEAVLARRDEVTSAGDDSGHLPWLEERGIALVRGHGSLVEDRVVEVEGERLNARCAVVLATGSSALMPPIEGLDTAMPWTNREATTAKEVPQSLLVLGGGVAGVELAQAWSALGTRVAVVEAEERLLTGEEDFVGRELRAALEADGIEVRTGERVTAADRGSQGARLSLESGETLIADELLVAAGRRANTDGLGVERLGIEPGEAIEVDERMRSRAADWLYAIGDVNGLSLLTHSGKYQARIAADAITGSDHDASSSSFAPPRVVFTDPQVAAVGATSVEARERGIAVEVVDSPTASTAGASFHGRDSIGTSRFVVDSDRGVLIGATFVGPDVCELLHAATIAVVAEVELDRLAHAVPAFPTRSELWLDLLEGCGR